MRITSTNGGAANLRKHDRWMDLPASSNIDFLLLLITPCSPRWVLFWSQRRGEAGREQQRGDAEMGKDRAGVQRCMRGRGVLFVSARWKWWGSEADRERFRIAKYGDKP